jgi:hypothetical protein
MKSYLYLLGLAIAVRLTDGFSPNSASSKRLVIWNNPLLLALSDDSADLPPEISFVDEGEENERKPYVPPDFTVEDDEDAIPSKTSATKSVYKSADFTVDKDDDPYPEQESTQKRPRPKRPKRKAVSSMTGTSWMKKNEQFSSQAEPKVEERAPAPSSQPRSDRDGRNNLSPATAKSFRQDFRATRLFVQGVPPGTSWQDLKDHFRVAGDVVFASVSVDMETGESKGHGIVQYQDSEMAQHAIKIMREHPLNGSPLFVREDVQENRGGAELRPKGPTPPTKWKCANEDNAEYLAPDEISAIRQLIKARDDARRRRKYEASDRIREELKHNHGVFVDDRLQMWWTSIDGNKVPQSIHDIKGEGRWKQKPWRQIPTTPENDACVNADLVEGLLRQRDISRREKDFRSADALLEEARKSPDGDLTLRIHDESRTWRIWTEAPPPKAVEYRDVNRDMKDPRDMRLQAAKECIEIVREHAPHKEDEIKTVLRKFHGREFLVLKRLKNQYLS